MWRTFIKCGRAIQVYVAKKKDKWGRCFGFVRFLEVKNIREMEIKLNQIKVGEQMIKANAARFSNYENKEKQNTPSSLRPGINRKITVSYAEAVKNGVRNQTEVKNREQKHDRGIERFRRKSEQGQWQGLEVQAEEEELKWLRDCFVGTAKSLVIISTLQDKFLMEGYFSAKVTPMGGNLVLISSADAEELKHLVEQGKDWLAQWFSNVRPWKPNEVAMERFTWLRCQGVPLHIWKSSFFETVACLCGKFISLDDSTIKKKRLDVAKILILTSVQENIQKVLRVKVGEKIFQIRVSEEVGVDNLFNLKSDFNLISDGVTNSEEWSDESNGEFCNEEEWEGDWQVLEDEDEVLQRSVTEEFAPVEPRRSMTMGKEEDGVSNKLLTHDDSLNAVNQNSNFVADGSKQISNRPQNTPIQSNLCIGPRQNSLDLGQKQHNQNEAWPICGEKAKTDTLASPKRSSNKRAFEDLRSKREGMANNGENPNQISEESVRSRSRAERLARDRKRRRQMERRMRKRSEIRRQKKKESRNRVSPSEALTKRGEACNSQTINSIQKQDSKKSCWREAEELWSVGKQLGLVDKNNVDEVIQRLKEMEERDRAAFATQKMVTKKRRGVKDLIKKEGADIVFIQESKMEVCDDRKCRSIWGGDNCNWVMKSTQGRAGGILCMWNSNLFEEKWSSYRVEGWEGFKLKEKFKLLKNDLKKWNKEVFGHIDRKLEEIRDEIKKLDDKAENGVLSASEIEQRQTCFQQFWEWSSRKDSLLFQKSRQKWQQEGDANSKFFHGCIAKRRKSNGIDGIMKNNVWIGEASEVKKFIKEYYELKFHDDEWNRPNIEFNEWKQLSSMENNWLTAQFTEEEIKEAVWNYNGNLMMEKLGFCLKWRRWIKECLSTSSISVLGNGSPIEEFSMKKGLRQGDPLAPFLFLMVAEALNGLILKAKEKDLYNGATVGTEGLEVTHLQFADDSIFFCEASKENIKTIKGILRIFELASGLKVNFFKSALYRTNVKSEETSERAETLNCLEGSIPFKYLGIPVGANPRNISTWTPVVDCLRRGDRKIAWVSWEKVCNSRKDGGLGVKDLEKFNMALLGKWRWRLVVEKEALWNRVVEAKYGIHRRRDWEGREVKMNSSYWWKALWKLDKERGSDEGWVYKGVVKTVGEGNDTLFWHEKWCGDAPFREKFNRLFRLAKDKDALVKNMGEWRNGEWIWKWSWSRELLGRENTLVQDLNRLLHGSKLE
ncbi:hypothetical protein SLEP1_g57855 [Rubroshorea leprosula]|uniref:Reverse transcriptase domain-containing protein n=1 Tax=Rubroshorea leprosula TaxID=152421 RepID=A0AAV5MNM8_9ROSI|nr:hypothetical protein SLEP1_g57855 [Rubroshorea leprosula]